MAGWFFNGFYYAVNFLAREVQTIDAMNKMKAEEAYKTGFMNAKDIGYANELMKVEEAQKFLGLAQHGPGPIEGRALRQMNKDVDFENLSIRDQAGHKLSDPIEASQKSGKDTAGESFSKASDASVMHSIGLP